MASGVQLNFAVDLHLVSLWTRSDPEVPESGQARVALEIPGGRELTIRDVPIDLTKTRFQRQLMHMTAFPLRGEGFYWWVIRQNRNGRWLRVARVPVDVRLSWPSQPPPP